MTAPPPPVMVGGAALWLRGTEARLLRAALALPAAARHYPRLRPGMERGADEAKLEDARSAEASDRDV